MDAETIKEWIMENRIIISGLVEALISECKRGSSSYSEVLEKLNKVRKAARWELHPTKHVIERIVELAREEITEEMKTLPVTRGIYEEGTSVITKPIDKKELNKIGGSIIGPSCRPGN